MSSTHTSPFGSGKSFSRREKGMLKQSNPSHVLHSHEGLRETPLAERMRTETVSRAKQGG